MNDETPISWGWDGDQYRYEERPRWILHYSRTTPDKVGVFVNMETRPTSYVIGLFINRGLLPSNIHKSAVHIQLDRWSGDTDAWWTADLVDDSEVIP